MEKKLYRLGGIPQCSYSNIVSNADELEKLELQPNSFASDHPGTSSMPSTENPEQRSYQVNLPHVSIDHDSFDEFNSQQKSKEIDESTCTNRKELLVKADLDSLESNIKTYVKVQRHELQISSRFEDQQSELDDDGIEKLSDIIVEEMKLIDSVFPVQEHEMALAIYKPPPTTPDEYCGVFVAVYAEYLSEGLDIPSLGIDAHYHRSRYASLLCKYVFLKVENGYFSENYNPQMPRMKFTPKETDRVLRIQ
ncbi:hypothetical protein CQW23_03535 [Capsicum baccatum]|uniref:Ubiquitin-like protease family profile domain-containing protein n=1 Tax=Capsicum baccatum TaxID=33114 RepID=A0A2G2XC74_CAPBA|nr:hypothetical protein CQW23_03535 [Capsicum baccatum]